MEGRIEFWKGGSGRGTGWGLVVVDDCPTKYFLHVSSIIAGGKPQTGAPVRFIPGRNSKGLIALNAEILLPEAQGFLAVTAAEGKTDGAS